MNIIVTSLFPESNIIEETKKTKAIYNLVQDEDNLIVLYPVILPSSFKTIFTHLRNPYYKIGKIRILKIPVLKIPKIEMYNLTALKIIVVLLDKRFKIKNIVFHRLNILISLLRFLNRKKLNYKYVIHASDIHLIEKYSENIEANKIHFRSHSLRKKTEKILNIELKNSIIAFSGIDKSHVLSNDKVRSLRWTTGPLKIITVCSLIKLKNVEEVLRALAKWSFEKWEYSIVGDGPEQEKLEKIAFELGIENKVVFTGQKKHNEVMKSLEDKHIFIMISKPETFGLVYLEAMSKGCVVFCAKNNGIDGIIENGYNGFSISNSKELLINLSKLVENRDYYYNVLEQTMNTINSFTSSKAKENYVDGILSEKHLRSN